MNDLEIEIFELKREVREQKIMIEKLSKDKIALQNDILRIGKNGNS